MLVTALKPPPYPPPLRTPQSAVLHCDRVGCATQAGVCFLLGTQLGTHLLVYNQLPLNPVGVLGALTPPRQRSLLNGAPDHTQFSGRVDESRTIVFSRKAVTPLPFWKDPWTGITFARGKTEFLSSLERRRDR